MSDINVNEPDKMPMDTPSVGAPSSGTYGEGAALDRLKAALPAGSVGAPPPPAAPGAPQMPPISTQPVTPTPEGEGRPPGPTAPAGIPAPLLAPSNQPDVPVGTPLASTAPNVNQLTDVQRRLQILDVLATSPGVSDTTRQWAQMVRKVLIGA